MELDESPETGTPSTIGDGQTTCSRGTITLRNSGTPYNLLGDVKSLEDGVFTEARTGIVKPVMHTDVKTDPTKTQTT